MKKYSVLLALLFFGVQTFAGNKKTFNADDYVAALKKVTDIMISDVTSPVAASRYYAYVTLAAYESQSLIDPVRFPSLGDHLNGFKKIHFDTQNPGSVDASLAVILSILKSGEQLLPSGYLLKKEIDLVASSFKKTKKDQLLFENTMSFAGQVVKSVLLYVRSDGFTRLNNMTRYTPKNDDAYWKPTAPSFMAPIEPHWSALRTFVLDSAQQFKTIPPAAYDTSVSSSFFIQLKEVYDIRNAADKEKQDKAMFWDCNPFAVQQLGHVEFGIKKISPGGHWVGITGIACRKEKLSIGKTAYVHVLVSIGLADAFIACWDEKYRSDRVRPETAIQKLIDPRWRPLLQTPPFPEYVSGHSVASTAAAVILTKIFGDKFSFADDSEVEFGLPVRKYGSFLEASSEAAISRLYGGIHFRDAIDEGIWQGREVAENLIAKLDNYFIAIAKK